jgi:hypothetical protein
MNGKPEGVPGTALPPAARLAPSTIRGVIRSRGER